jgi:UDP-2-acetamido-3-amino-2,3-dideoxy-glucuronate N-acetyltransferase
MTDSEHAPFIHPSASIEDGVRIGSGTRVWALTQVRTGASVGRNCTIGRNVFIDLGVVVGNDVKIENNALLYEGLCLHDGVFVGPHVVFTNDKIPRAVSPNGNVKSAGDWTLGRTEVFDGAAIGAGAVVVTGVTIGRWAMIAAGSVVTKNVSDHALVIGNPGRVVGYVSAEGTRCPTLEDAQRATRNEQQ